MRCNQSGCTEKRGRPEVRGRVPTLPRTMDRRGLPVTRGYRRDRVLVRQADPDATLGTASGQAVVFSPVWVATRTLRSIVGCNRSPTPQQERRMHTMISRISCRRSLGLAMFSVEGVANARGTVGEPTFEVRPVHRSVRPDDRGGTLGIGATTTVRRTPADHSFRLDLAANGSFDRRSPDTRDAGTARQVIDLRSPRHARREWQVTGRETLSDFCQ